MSVFVIVEPGAGIVQGECLGLLFCYCGPDSDLPVSEILFLDSYEKAEEVRRNILSDATTTNSNSLANLRAMRVECVDGIDLDALAISVSKELSGCLTKGDN